MAFNERLAERVRRALATRRDVRERRMFGGLAFMVRGHMCVGITGDDLMVRVGPEGYERALRRRHARPMDFTGKALRGFVYVAPAGTAAAASLRSWLRPALDWVGKQPRK
ncbi:MAG: TfoX/Sxy family protein [Gemmatimonadales bacterium]